MATMRGKGKGDGVRVGAIYSIIANEMAQQQLELEQKHDNGVEGQKGVFP